MKSETQEWIDKVEDDRKVARREINAVDPVWNVVCCDFQLCYTHCTPLEREHYRY